MLVLLLLLTSLISISFTTEIKTVITPSTSDRNPYITTNTKNKETAWSIISSQPFQLTLTNLTGFHDYFHPILISTINITMHSDINHEILTNEALDILISFVFNSKHFTVKINMNNQQNNKISPQCSSYLSTNNILSSLTDNTIPSKWDSIRQINQYQYTNLTPSNINIFPLQFIIEKNHNENYIIFTYKSSDDSNYIQQCQFIESLPSNQGMDIFISTDKESQRVNITQFDITYNDILTDIINAEYLLIIRNKNVFNQYEYNKDTIRSKIAFAVAQYFRSSTYGVIITDVEYKTDKDDTDIIFGLQKSNNIDWNNDEIDYIYASYKDPQFYYFLAFYLNLQWEINENADFILNQYKNGNEMHIKRDYMNLYLIDFPFVINTGNTTTKTADITTTERSNIDNNKVNKHITTSLMDKAVRTTMDDHHTEQHINGNVLAESGRNRENEEIMSWGAFAAIVVLLLLLILLMGVLIICLNSKTRTLQSIGKKRDSMRVLKAQNSGLSMAGISAIPQSPSVECVPIHHEMAGIGAEGRRQSAQNGHNGHNAKPPIIDVDENIAQPPSAQIGNIMKYEMPKKGSLHLGNQRSMEFDVHLSNVVVGDEIVMNDIIDDMEQGHDGNNNNDDDMNIMSETPGGDTPGGHYHDELRALNNNNNHHHKLDDDAKSNNHEDDDQYFGDLTPHGQYKQ